MSDLIWYRLKDYAADGYGCWIDADGRILPIPVQAHERVAERLAGRGGRSLFRLDLGWVEVSHAGGEFVLNFYNPTRAAKATALALLKDLNRTGRFHYYSVNGTGLKRDYAEYLAAVEEELEADAVLRGTGDRPVATACQQVPYDYDADDEFPRKAKFDPIIPHAMLCLDRPGHEPAWDNPHCVEVLRYAEDGGTSNKHAFTLSDERCDQILDFGQRHWGTLHRIFVFEPHDYERTEAISDVFRMVFGKAEPEWTVNYNKSYREQLLARAAARGLTDPTGS